MFTFLFTFFVYLESGGKFKNLKFGLKFGYEVEFGLKFGYEFEFEFEFKLKGLLKCFKKKCLGSPCYLMVVSGGSLSLGGLNRDTRRCFLWCLQVSSSSSLLFNIEFWSALRITSFSVRHRSHVRPPLENG
jgi:hypothetical protein